MPRIEIKDGSITEVLYELEQHLESLPKKSGLNKDRLGGAGLDAFKRIMTRFMYKMEPGSEESIPFQRTSIIIEKSVVDTYYLCVVVD